MTARSRGGERESQRPRAEDADCGSANPGRDSRQIDHIAASTAQRMLWHAQAHGETLDHQRYAMGVVDAHGTLSAFARMDGAPLLAVGNAQDKAYTAASFRIGTYSWYDVIKGDPPLRLGMPAGADRLVAFGGGYPATVSGSVVGAIGVSGGHYDEDMRVAQTGLSKLSADAAVSRSLGRFVVEARVPDFARRQSARAILNALAAALAAIPDPAMASILATVTQGPGDRRSRVVWLADRTSPEHAALMNAALIHHADFDDTHVPTVVHASAPVLGALLAELEVQPVSGARLLDAFAIGVEVAVAVASMLMPGHYRRGFHVTATAGTVGAAAGICALYDLDEQQAANALALAAHRAAGFKEGIGSVAKAVGVGCAASQGLICSQMARFGVTATDSLFEGRSGLVASTTNYSPERAYAGLADLGVHWAVTDLALKHFPTGVAMHAPIEAALALRASISESERRRVTALSIGVDPLVEEHWRTATGHQSEERLVSTPLEAKFSLKYCVAVSWLAGDPTRHLLDLRTPNEDAIGFSRRLSVVADETVTMNGCKLTAHFAGGETETVTIVRHKGVPPNRLTDRELCDKARMVERRVGKAGDGKWCHAVLDLAEAVNARSVFRRLRLTDRI